MSSRGNLEDFSFHALASLTLTPARSGELLPALAALDDASFEQFCSLAAANHVIVRALEPLETAAEKAGDAKLAGRCKILIDRERRRIANAIEWLHRITSTLEAEGCPMTVMKSLDHWPDLGSDLDLYTTADAHAVRRMMQKCLGARLEPQSWGDRLADKWNFRIDGLPEPIELHARRLGQTGEQLALARRFQVRRVRCCVMGHEFHVPAPEERILVAALQRMYRHFYIRVCDIANIARLIDSGAVRFAELHRAAQLGGIWKGVCCLLRIVSDYVGQQRGTPLKLPPEVISAAPFGGEHLHVRGQFLRLPILPDAAGLFAAEFASAARRGDMAATMRLSLFPCLASAAAIRYKITGSDKGIW
jgi:hypothetical protein